jgi:hypothetical protein
LWIFDCGLREKNRTSKRNSGMRKGPSVSLLPYLVFSFFHSLSFIKNEIVTKLPQKFKQLAPSITSLVSKYQPKAVALVSKLEPWVIMRKFNHYIVLTVLAMTVVAIFWGSSFFLPIIYFQFLSFRYLCSPMTKEAVHQMGAFLDTNIEANTRIPEPVRKGYTTIKVYCSRGYSNL